MGTGRTSPPHQRSQLGQADVLLIAGERDLFLFDLETEEVETLCLLEQDRPKNRPNDGRADPLGGFWIGTMAKDESANQGAIYRYYRGELRQLYVDISIPNAICFPPGATSSPSSRCTGERDSASPDEVSART